MILSICDVPEVLKVIRIIKIVIEIIKIAVPIILIVSLMIDLTKAELSNDSDAINKTGKLSINKIIAVVLIFLIPTFVNIITNVVMPGFSYSSCINNATEEGITASYETNMKKIMDEANDKKDFNSYSVAISYLKNIKNKELYQKYSEELKAIKKKIDEENEKNHNHGSGAPIDMIDPTAPYVPGTLGASTFLQTAKNVWDRIVLGNQNFKYNQGNRVPVMNNLCDCSTYVSWVIYEYGYKDWEGHQRNTSMLYHTNYNKLYGWEEYYYPGRTDLTNIVQPGDIIVRRNSAGGHTDIVASVSGGVVKAYDCGSNESIANHKYPDGYPNPGFLKDAGKYRPAKIIRVKK